MKQFYRLTPHFRLSNNPIFTLETRRVRRGESAKALIDTSVLLIVAVCVVLLVFWLVLNLIDPSTRFRISAGDGFLYMLFPLSLLVALVLDYTCMMVSIGSVNGEIAAGRWDLLLMTALESKQIVAAKHGAAQVRAWRMMVLVVALRAAVVVIGGLTAASAIFNDQSRYASVDMPLISIVLLVIVAVACAVFYVVEPFWRMRTVTAIGLAVSARVGHTVSSVVFGVGALAAFWLAQGFVALALIVILGIVIVPLTSVEVMLAQAVICSPILALIAFVVMIYGFYSVAYNWGMRRALRFTARLDLSERKAL